MERSKHVCITCEATFTKKRNLLRHQRTKHGSNIVRAQCPYCFKYFTRNSDLNKHLKLHTIEKHPCQVCGKIFETLQALVDHLFIHTTSSNSLPISVPATSNIHTIFRLPEIKMDLPDSSTNLNISSGVEGPKDCDFQYALNGAAAVYKFPVSSEEIDMTTLFAFFHNRLELLLSERLKNSGLKWFFACKIHFVKASDDSIETTSFFRSKNIETMDKHTISDQLKNAYIESEHNCAQFQRQGSDWVIKSILTIELNILKYIPLAGSSYIPLPLELHAKKAIINVQNSDNLCFAWAVLAGINNLDRNQHPERISNYNINDLNLQGINFPLKLSQVNKFETQNNISVNIFGYDKQDPIGKGKKEVFPLYKSKLKSEKTVDLLLISEGSLQHYTCIRSLSRLLNDLTNHHGKSHICRLCLHRYSSESLLFEHLKLCEGYGVQKIRMPEDKEKWMKFKNIKHQMRVPYTIYADFESILEKVQTCIPNPKLSSSTPTSVHTPSGFGYIIIGEEGNIIEGPVIYRGKNVVDEFLQHMLKLEERFNIKLHKNEPMIFTEEDKLNFENATHCHICKKPLNGDSVKDHNHLNSKFRGAAHSNCNINYTVAKHIPVIFHGLKNYDLHLIMQGIGKIKHKKISCIPNNMEKYIAFTLGSLRFIDSFQFMSASLESLVSNLCVDENNFKITKKCIPNEQFALMLRKGVFPYKYIDNEKKFDETSLPSQIEFYNDLTLTPLSDEDYKHAHDVWNTCKIQNLGQYHDLYLLSDVCLLSDVFENFRTVCMNTYNLDACHFYTSPGLSWEASLKLTEVNLELLTDIDMHMFIEKGIRGGVSMISTRYASANNKYLDNYDPSKPSSHIIYLDANNLYAWALALPLPIDTFKWVEPELLNEIDFLNVPNDSEIGYILSVDLEYPEELHELHNDYPLAPEALEINYEMLSPYSKELRKSLNYQTNYTSTKLVPNLYDKKEYILHYRNLQQYISLGLQLTKI